jgi:signal transduction histidine kinase
VLGVLCAGLVITALAFAVVTQRDESRAVAQLTGEAERITASLSESLGIGVANVRSIQALFEASDDVAPHVFSRFAIRQTASPGQIASGYAAVVPIDELETWEAARMEERPYFQVLGVDRRPLDTRGRGGSAVPVLQRHEYQVMPNVLGVDLASDPRRRNAIEQALDQTSPVMTGFVAGPVRDLGPYVEIYARVGDGDATQAGVVFAILDVNQLIHDSIAAPPSIEVTIADAGVGATGPSIRQPRRYVEHVIIEHRRWRVEVTSSAPLGDVTFLAAMTAAGVVISLLAAAVTALVARSRARERELGLLRRTTDEKDIFLASVAHELRTPLTGVVGMTAVLSEGWRELSETEVDELLGVAHSEAADLSDLIEDLLVAGRLEAGAINYRRELVDLSSEVRRVAERVSPSQDLTLLLPGRGPLVEADALRVRQIVRNLIVNASRYGHSLIEVEALPGDGTVVLEIRNDGPPIPPPIVATLFEPYRAARQRPGQPGSIGLGLHISRTLARAMAGELDYTYREGRCVFVVTLPEAPHVIVPASVLAPHTRTHTRSPGATG